MRLKKVIGFIVVIVIIACMFPITITASTGFALGEFTVISKNNQQNGWCTNGVDGIETKFYIRALQKVESFFFDFDCEVDNVTFVCFGDGNGWAWKEIPVYIDGGGRGHIDIKDIEDWAEIISGNDVKILLCNYNPSWENITVNGFTSIGGGWFENREAWTPKNFKIGPGKTIITAVDFDPDSFEEHGAEYDRYILRPEMEAVNGPQTEVGWSGFGDNICCIDAGEWVQYTVEVTATGTYNFSAWLAKDYGSSGNIEIYADDEFVGASVNSADGYYDLYPVGSIDLTNGTHIIKTVFPKGGILFSAIEVVSLGILEETSNIISSSPSTSDKINITVKEITSGLEYDIIYPFQDGLAVAIKDMIKGIHDTSGGKYGFINKFGKEVIPCEYDYAESFSDGLAVVKKDDKFGFIDKTGKIIISIEYDGIRSFSEGLALVIKNEKRGYINRAGKITLPLEYNYAESFSEGLAVVCIGDLENSKWGYIDKTGAVIIPIEYDYAESFSDGLALVEKNGKRGYIDKTGKIIIPLEYDYAAPFSEGLASIRLGDWWTGKWGHIDKTGNIVVPLEYDYTAPFHEGLASVRIGDSGTGKWGCVDKTGTVIVSIEYDLVGDNYKICSDDLIRVMKDHKYGFINKIGKIIIPLEYGFAEPFNAGLAAVANNESKFGYIDKTGKIIVPLEYDGAIGFSEGLALVIKNGKYAILEIGSYESPKTGDINLKSYIA